MATTSTSPPAAKLLPSDKPSDIRYDPRTHSYTWPTFSDHRSGNAKWHLPRTRQYGNCVIDVRLNRGVRSEVSSWGFVARAASNVITECVQWGGGRGGKGATGETESIEVTVYSVVADGAGVLNGTLVVASR